MKCINDLIELCENNVPISLRSLINTIKQEEEFEVYRYNSPTCSSSYYSMCQLELYEEVDYERVCAWNFTTITANSLRNGYDNYDIHVSRTDLTIIGLEDDETIPNRHTQVNLDDTVYIVCIADESGDIANMNIAEYPGGPEWEDVKRYE